MQGSSEFNSLINSEYNKFIVGLADWRLQLEEVIVIDCGQYARH